jgi:EmrB/QacA subfamily drug resistance transporter
MQHHRRVEASAATADRVGEQRNVLVVIGALMIVLLLAALDQTIVATALPTIAGDFGQLSHISWVVSAYLLAQTAVTPLYGKLGDLYGRKRMLQVAILIFLCGSALCGAAQSMTELIVFRAVQGLGGGGLIVLTQAAIGDVVAPRERGRYQGLFGAVFGLASVLGPLLGGLFVEQLSWRWIFYVNIPLGIVAIGVLGATLPSVRREARPVIDYLGAGLLAAGLSAIILVTSLGGNTWAWASPQLIGVAAAGVLLLLTFLLVERRATEPILPLALFRNRVFAVGSALGLIVGFAMFGAITFLPLFFQTVNGAGPTTSGLRLVPMMVGLVLTSVGSGQVISRIGRSKPFPVAGTAIVTVGFVLLSTMGTGTSSLHAALDLFVVGLGLGLVMQVLVLAVQNAVDYSQLGVATSGATLFRSIGGALGTAVFGAIFTSRLTSELGRQLGSGAAHINVAGGRISPTALKHLPPPVHHAYLVAFTHSLTSVFVVAAAITGVSFLLSWMLPDRPLRDTVAASGASEHFAVPRSPDSLEEIRRALTVLARRDTHRQLYVEIARRAGVELSPAQSWALARIADTPGGLDIAASRWGVEPATARAALEHLEAEGLVRRDGAQSLELTAAGQETLARLMDARRERLAEQLDGWSPEQEQEVARLLTRLARDLVADGEPERRRPVARGAAV